MSSATVCIVMGSIILISFMFCAWNCAPPRQLKCLPSPPGSPPSPPGSSHVYSVVFWDLVKMLVWRLRWPHWASILLKVGPKRRHFEVWELPGALTGNCTPAYTGTPFSLFWEVIKSRLFEHFSKSILWRLNLNPFGFINTGIGQKVLQNGTPLRQSNWEFGPQWVT